VNVITVPVDAHFVTLEIESFRIEEREVRAGPKTERRRERVRDVRRVAPLEDEKTLRVALEFTNRVFEPAGLRLLLRSCDYPSVAAPGNADKVSPEGFLELAHLFPRRAGASLLVVYLFEGADLGGQAAELLGVCITRSFRNEQLGKVVAHELGHLLALEHEKDAYNLMYPALRAGDRLIDEQIERARKSALATSV
jgi:hypothetical protein